VAADEGEAGRMTAKPLVPILMVDDNRAKRLALKAVLLPLGHTIVEADSGRGALRCVMEQDFAVILMDVLMPVMDGFETAALIRQRAQSQMTPIIFITAHGKDEIQRPDLYAAGAVDFIFAPVPPNELRAKVSVFANLFSQAEQLAASAREVQSSADRLRLLTDAAPVGIFQTDPQNRYVYTNPRWTEITGISAEEAEGKPWDSIITSDQRAGLAARLSEDEPDRAELSHRFTLQPDGSDPLIVLATSKSIPDNEGGTAGWVGTLADVTAEAGAEAAMSDARDKATEASRLKSHFLANMSHEIRTPMNGVIGMTDLLLETQLDPRQRDYALTVRSSGQALLGIIEDILDFSKVEAGQLEIEEIDFDLRVTIDAVMDLLAGSARAKGLELVVAIASDIPAVVGGDPGRLRQVLINLIGNAIKFTQAGEVVLRVTSLQTSGNDTVVRFLVSDTGDGMAPDKLALIFQPFVQGDASTSRKYGGSGLGLAITSQLVELMGGRCGVSSRFGEGSDFWFTISVRSVPSQAPHDLLSDAGLAGVSVLIADGSATQRDVLSAYLTEWGMTVESADSGRGALAALRAAATRPRPFDVALLDTSLAGGNGADLIDEIVADPAIAAQLVLMVALAEEGDFAAPELDACPRLSKPVHLEDLRRCLRVAAGLEEAEAPVARAPRLPSESTEEAPGRVLLAEDNVVNQKVAVAMLAGAGYRVDTVLNGAEAVNAIRLRRYDAILMDCQMPVMNGYEATIAIRAQEGQGQRVPIIAITAAARAKDRDRCISAGMDGYLAKPVCKEDLLAVVARYVTNDPWPVGVLDENVVSELEALDGDVMLGLVSLYFDQASDQMSELSAAIASGETPAIAQIAHKLKGSSATLGAKNVAGIASELELAAGTGDPASAEPLLNTLSTGLDDARDAFRSRMGAAGGALATLHDVTRSGAAPA
jgi:two-component system sensor histidine kinase/response regulator